MELDSNPRPCPGCGLAGCRLKRRDHYLSLFFIPLIPVKRGEIYLECSHCGGVFDPSGGPAGGGAGRRPDHGLCPACRRPVEPGFAYCPYCGRRL